MDYLHQHAFAKLLPVDYLDGHLLTADALHAKLDEARLTLAEGLLEPIGPHILADLRNALPVFLHVRFRYSASNESEQFEFGHRRLNRIKQPGDIGSFHRNGSEIKNQFKST